MAMLVVGYTDDQFPPEHSHKIVLFDFLTAQYFMFLPWITNALKFQVLFPSPSLFFHIDFLRCAYKA